VFIVVDLLFRGSGNQYPAVVECHGEYRRVVVGERAKKRPLAVDVYRVRGYGERLADAAPNRELAGERAGVDPHRVGPLARRLRPVGAPVG